MVEQKVSSPMKTFVGFSGTLTEQDTETVTKKKRFTLVTKSEREQRIKHASPGAVSKQLKSGYKSVHDKFFSHRNVPNRNIVANRLSQMMKRNRNRTAMEEVVKIEERDKYLNILSNCTHHVTYNSPAPGFNLVNKARSLKPKGFLFEQADRSTTEKKTEKILTSTARKPGHPPPEVVTLVDQSPSVITLDDRIGFARKSSIVVEEVEPCQTPVSSLPKHFNTMEDDLRTKAVYSPHFLEELRKKYDRRRRETCLLYTSDAADE